jgi:hypothetical protein
MLVKASLEHRTLTPTAAANVLDGERLGARRSMRTTAFLMDRGAAHSSPASPRNGSSAGHPTVHLSAASPVVERQRVVYHPFA